MNAREQAHVDLLPDDGSTMTFDDWKTAAYSSGAGASLPRWLSLKQRGEIVLENVRANPDDPRSGVLQVSRPVAP